MKVCLLNNDMLKRHLGDLALKGWLTVFFLGLIVFMGCSLACVHACFFKNALFFT